MEGFRGLGHNNSWSQTRTDVSIIARQTIVIFGGAFRGTLFSWPKRLAYHKESKVHSNGVSTILVEDTRQDVNF